MIVEILIQKIIYKIFITVFLICALKVFGNQSLSGTCRDTVNGIKKRQASQSSIETEISFLQNNAYTLLSNFNKEEWSESVRKARGLFVSVDITRGVEEGNLLKQIFNLRVNPTAGSQMSFVIVHDRESEGRAASFLNDISFSVRSVYWNRIEVKNKNRNFVHHFQRALEQGIHTVFVILESDFEEILSSLDPSVYSSIVEHTNGVYLPSIQLLSEQNQVHLFHFVKEVQKSSFVFGVFFSKNKPHLPEEKKRDSRYYSFKPRKQAVSTKPEYSYSEVLQVLRDHEASHWTAYHTLRTQGNLPKALPKVPQRYYAEEWQGKMRFLAEKKNILMKKPWRLWLIII